MTGCSRCDALAESLQEVLAWAGSDAVKAALFNSWFHGQRASAEQTQKVDAMWARARKLIETQHEEEKT